jgi:dihydroceramidase
MRSSNVEYGWWGKPTSSVDWCEDNYAWSHYVAEFYNTFSSFSIFFFGIYGYVKHKHQLSFRYDLLLMSYTLVGWGSAAFHGTLLFPFQCLDELPMCYTAIIMVYCALEDQKQQKYGWTLPSLFFLWAALITYAVTSSSHKWQFYVFHTSFGVLELAVAYLTYKKTRPYPYLCAWYKKSLKGYLIGITVWLTDLNFCHILQKLPFNPQLHR